MKNGFLVAGELLIIAASLLAVFMPFVSFPVLIAFITLAAACVLAGFVCIGLSFVTLNLKHDATPFSSANSPSQGDDRAASPYQSLGQNVTSEPTQPDQSRNLFSSAPAPVIPVAAANLAP